MLVPLSSFMALQMRQQQQQQQQQVVNTSQSANSSAEKSSDANKEVQQIDGYPPLLTHSFQVQDRARSDESDRDLLQLPNQSSMSVLYSEGPSLSCQPCDPTSHRPMSLIDKDICANGVSETDRRARESAEAIEVPTNSEEIFRPSEIKRNLSTHREVTLSGKPETKLSHSKGAVRLPRRGDRGAVRLPRSKGAVRLPRRGDRVEFIIERAQTGLEQLVKGQKSSSKGERSKFIVQLDGGADGSSSEDDSDLDDSSDVRCLFIYLFVCVFQRGWVGQIHIIFMSCRGKTPLL